MPVFLFTFIFGQWGWNKFGEIVHPRPGRRQNFGQTVHGWPAWFSFLGPAFTAVKRGRVQPTAFGQPRTRHLMFAGEPFNGIPYIFVRHFSLLLL